MESRHAEGGRRRIKLLHRYMREILLFITATYLATYQLVCLLVGIILVRYYTLSDISGEI